MSAERDRGEQRGVLLEFAPRQSAEVTIEVPAGMLGPSEFDSALDRMLRRIAKATGEQLGVEEWNEKYGVVVDCDVFMMHPECYCERSDCPWCRCCQCPSETVHYWVDGKEVDYDEWMDFFRREAGRAPEIADFAGRDYGGFDDDWEPTAEQSAALERARAEWDELADRANERRSQTTTPTCDFCLKHGGKAAPNFHHKPTGLVVRWYKYIGRSVEVEVPDGIDISLADVEASCMAAIKQLTRS